MFSADDADVTRVVVTFSSEELELVFARAKFDGKNLENWLRDLALERARWSSWTKLISTVPG